MKHAYRCIDLMDPVEAGATSSLVNIYSLAYGFLSYFLSALHWYYPVDSLASRSYV
jgi:hypothetical protein